MTAPPRCDFELEFVWRTDQGRVRARNEDAVAVHPDCGLVVVADGVGGAKAGDVASRLAANTIAERFQRRATFCADPEKSRLFVEAAVEEANITIWRQGKQRDGCIGMGTTVVVGALGRDWITLAHVGDSRIYRLRDGLFEQLSRDHSFIQDVIDQGFFASREDAKRYGIGDNILTRALGSSPDVGIASEITELASGDLYLFCTDGLTGMLPDAWLRQMLMAVTDNSLDSAADALIRMANERGGNDNITLALIRVGERLVAESAVGHRADVF